MKIKIIGIDCATDNRKTGLALGSFNNDKVILLKARPGEVNMPIVKIIKNWVFDSDKVLIAIDAPLGWPIAMGEMLAEHVAGGFINLDSNDFFRRKTDKNIKKKINKQPLDVGADRIARTAHTALIIIENLRKEYHSVSLAWDRDMKNKINIIEVYPAGTLEAHKLPSNRYKKGDEIENRKKIISGINKYLEFEDRESIENILCENSDALDAAVCILAARDFLKGDVFEPEDIDLAKKEGWIWMKND